MVEQGLGEIKTNFIKSYKEVVERHDCLHSESHFLLISDKKVIFVSLMFDWISGCLHETKFD